MERKKLNLFRTVKKPNEKYIIVTGGIQASKREFKTQEEAQKYIDKKPWELIFALIIAVKLNEKNETKDTEKQ